MKKLIALLLSVIAAFSMLAFSACSTNHDTIVIAVPDGAPALALYNMMAHCKRANGYNVEYKILTGAANIGTVVVSGEADCAIMPVNAAAKLYNKGTDIKLLSVNVFGVLYMVGNEALEDMQDLIGKVVLNIGAGGTPDLALKKILDGNNIPYVTSETPVEGKVALRYVGDAAEVMATLKAGRADYGVMGEPAASLACGKIGVQIVMDLQEKWQELVGNDSFTQAGFVMNSRVYGDTALVEKLYSYLSANAEVAAKEADSVPGMLKKYGSTATAQVNADVLSRCNLGAARAYEIKSSIEEYFTAIVAYDKTFVGGALPNDGFYYQA